MLKATYINPETLNAIHAGNIPHGNLLLVGNDKTGKRGRYGRMFRTRGLPVHDCNWKTSACASACYAVKPVLWNIDKGIDVGQEYSFLAHHDPCALYDRLHAEITQAVAKHGTIVVRIHEAGDFVSRMHVRVYTWLASAFPTVTFYGYSRAFVDPTMAQALNELNAMPNVVVRESTDNDRPVGTGHAADAFFGNKDLEPKRAFKCIEQLNGTKCIDCGLCWTQAKLAVVFKKH
jgi:hypothetical protein